MRIESTNDKGLYKITLNGKELRFVLLADDTANEVGYFMSKDGKLRYDEFGEPIYVYTKGIVTIEVIDE